MKGDVYTVAGWNEFLINTVLDAVPEDGIIYAKNAAQKIASDMESVYVAREYMDMVDDGQPMSKCIAQRLGTIAPEIPRPARTVIADRIVRCMEECPDVYSKFKEKDKYTLLRKVVDFMIGEGKQFDLHMQMAIQARSKYILWANIGDPGTVTLQRVQDWVRDRLHGMPISFAARHAIARAIYTVFYVMKDE